jgi:hypothetical protein
VLKVAAPEPFGAGVPHIGRDETQPDDPEQPATARPELDLV